MPGHLRMGPRMANQPQNMNNKEAELNRIIDTVVQCCAIDIDGSGRMSITRGDVLGTSKASNAVMTRCILVTQILAAGYSTATVAMLLNRSPHQVRRMLDEDTQFRRTSRAYRIAAAEATLLCKDLP